MLQKLGHPLHSDMIASTTTSLNWTRRVYASGGHRDANMDSSFHIPPKKRIQVASNIVLNKCMFRFAGWKRFEVSGCVVASIQEVLAVRLTLGAAMIPA